MSAFHFLTPEYLFFLLPAWAMVWWLLKQQSDEKKWKEMMDEKMLRHLLLPSDNHASKVPAPWHLGVVLTLLIVALAAPSWKLKESPFTEDDTKIALLISTKKSMLTSDIEPTRLSRATIKISNLLEQRADTQSALIAYSGTAHLVLPLTKDHSIIQSFSQALEPAIMPLEGDNIKEALLLAQKELRSKGATVIVLTDSVSPSSVKLAIKEGFKNMNVIFWQIASNELANVDDFKSAASIAEGSFVSYRRDGNDVEIVSSYIDKNYKNSVQDENNRYENGGYYLVPFIFILMLLWARQGFIAELWRRA